MGCVHFSLDKNYIRAHTNIRSKLFKTIRSPSDTGARKEDMELELVSSYSNSSGSTGANAYASEVWNGKIGGKCFTVTLNSMGAPAWEGDDLDQDEQIEVMNEIYEKSGL